MKNSDKVESFEDWSKRLEEEYSSTKTAIGFKVWIEKFKKENSKFNTTFKEFVEKKRVGRQIQNWEIRFLGTFIAKHFYSDEYDENRFMSKSGKSKNETRTFDERGDWGGFLKKVWEGICLNEKATGRDHSFSDRLGKPSEKTLSVNDGRKGNLRWIELCSALQKEFNVFDSLQTLNKFITTAFRVDHPNDLSDYGLYIRNIDDLCIAYGILNGKSIEEIIKLIKDCREIIKDKQKEVIPYTAAKTITKQLEGDFAGLIGMSKDVFVSRVKGCSQKFLSEDADNHWSLLKDVLKDIYEIVEKMKGRRESEIKNEIKSIFDDKNETPTTKNFIERLRLLKEEFSYVIKINNEQNQKASKDDNKETLFFCIIQRLLINGKDKELLGLFDDLKTITKHYKGNKLTDIVETIDYEQEEQLKKDEKEIPLINETDFNFSISNLRSIYIVTLMKYISEFEAIDDVEIVVEDINCELEKRDLRTIDYKIKGSEFINSSTDIFDWFIVECIMRDKSANVKGAYISGFAPFYEFMGLN